MNNWAERRPSLITARAEREINHKCFPARLKKSFLKRLLVYLPLVSNELHTPSLDE